jgi:DNA-binding MarR family transcriptional regulator
MQYVTAPRRRPASGDSSLAAQADDVLRASRALVGIAAASLASIGDAVTLPQFRVLVLVYTRGPLNLASVANALDVNPSNASRTCDSLVKTGLLDRRESAVDRRNVVLNLTPAGRRLMEKVNKRRRAAIERVLRTMSASKRGALAEALALFAAAAGEPDDARLLTAIWPPTS